MKRLLLLFALFQFPTGKIPDRMHSGYAPIVDAIQVPGDSWVVWSGDLASCSSGGHFKKVGGSDGWSGPECEGGKRWTCEDKQRVLLTSEDGKHFCMKVQFD